MNAALPASAGPDLERRFGGLRRLYGDAGYTAVRAARVVVVGLGGVGSWAAEALARSGVAALTLIDLDHVAESNINRQVQALGATLGQHKGQALAARLADIHPGCELHVVDAFVEAGNWPALLGGRPVDVLIDACDDARAKQLLAAWALAAGVSLICAGAAGGKREPARVAVADLAETTHDPLLARLRQRLRHEGVAPRQGRIGIRCVYSAEPVVRPQRDDGDDCAVDGSLNCQGYGSSVVVTAAFGLVAAGEALARVQAQAKQPSPRTQHLGAGALEQPQNRAIL